VGGYFTAVNKATIFGYQLNPQEPYQYIIAWAIVTLALLGVAEFIPALAVSLSLGLLLAVALAYYL